LAKKYGVSIVGGDTVESRVMSVGVSLLGRVKRGGATLRSGARSGDVIVVTGRLGGSILKKHFTFTPRLDLAKWLTRRVKLHAMIDISDGLAQDLGHILKASGKGARIYLDDFPVAGAARTVARSKKTDPRKLALTDGEDFELLFTVSKRDGKTLPRSVKGVPLTVIGEITGPGKKLQVFETRRATQALKQIQLKGFQHFAS